MYRETGYIRRALLAGAVAAVIAAGHSAFADRSLSLEADTSVAHAGYYQLKWDAGGETVRLVEATNPQFSDSRIVYDGADTARLMSGKPDGRYYYRLELDAPGTAPVVSDTVIVSVKHHSLKRAFAFFGLGAAVFVATLALILIGGRDERG